MSINRIIGILSLIIAPYTCFSQVEIEQEKKLNSLLTKLRKADSRLRSNLLIKKISNLDIEYDSIVKHIKSGIYYPNKSKTGFIEWKYRLDSLNYLCYVFVPSNYSVYKKYPASFILHGAVMSPDSLALKKYINEKSYDTDSLDRIIVYPAGWARSPWWDKKQVNNLNYLIRKLKKAYNIDENNISLAGISDGGTGIIYLASFNITPWANFRPYISNPIALGRLSQETIFLKNLGNKPFLFISSEKDQLFPPRNIEEFLSKMKKASNSYEYYLAKGYKHEISWIPEYADTIDRFMDNNYRNPYPNKLFWQTDNTDYGRNHWVIINELEIKSKNPKQNYPVLGNFKDVRGWVQGSIKVIANNNIIKVKTANITKYTLLLSPEQFNFNEEFQIYTNDELSFKGKLEKDIQVLLKWYSKDLDRTMLFGNKITIEVND